jgi:hypothetical protein
MGTPAAGDGNKSSGGSGATRGRRHDNTPWTVLVRQRVRLAAG